MNDSQPAPGHSAGIGSFGFLFSHDETVRPDAEDGNDPDRTDRTDDEAGPGRPLEMRFSGDGESTDRRAAS